MTNDCKETARTMQYEETKKRTNGHTGPANPTAEAIITRLPDRPLVNAREIADALSMTSTGGVTAAIEEGMLRAV